MRPLLRMRLLLILTTTLLAGACGPGSEVVRPEGDPFDPARLFPMAEDNVWTFDIDDGSGETAFHFLRVVGAEGNRRHIAVPSGEAETYEIRPEGLYNVTRDSWTLKRPVEEGAEWPARGGRTARVTSTSARVSVPADTFEGCVRVSETGGENGLETHTTYCPDVGPVLIETTLPLETTPVPATVIARLRAHQLATP